MIRMAMLRAGLAAMVPMAGLGLMLAATPATAQFSDAYTFLKAVKDKDAAKAREMIEKPGNAFVNTRDSETGETPLHIVTRRSDSAWLGFILQAGANINARDRDGNTALLIAAQTRWTEGVQILISVRAQVDAQNRLGETALQKAVQNRDTTTAKVLIDAGASPDIGDNSGVTARSLADSDPRAAAMARLLKDVPVRKPKPTQGPSI